MTQLAVFAMPIPIAIDSPWQCQSEPLKRCKRRHSQLGLLLNKKSPKHTRDCILKCNIIDEPTFIAQNYGFYINK